MKFIDISMPLHERMVVWPAGQLARRSLGEGGEKFSRAEIKSGSAIISMLKMSSHTGTHIDAPKHFIKGGKGIGGIDLDKLIGPSRVIEIKPEISLPLLKIHNIKKGERILIKTENSRQKLLHRHDFTANYVSLDIAAAKYLVKKKINLIGVDYLGIEAKGSPGHPVHKTLLRAEIVIVEGLDLSKVSPGRYNLAVLPLNIAGGDGSPARAVLWGGKQTLP